MLAETKNYQAPAAIALAAVAAQVASKPTTTQETFQPESFTHANMTDEGNAENILKMDLEFRYIPEIHDFALWDKVKMTWLMGAEDQIKEAAVKSARLRGEAAKLIHVNGDDNGGVKDRHKKEQIKFALQSENQPRLRAAVAALASKPSLATSINEWDKNPLKAGLRDGLMVDFIDNYIRPANSVDMVTKVIKSGKPVPGSWKGSQWDAFISSIFVTKDGERDEALARWIQKAIGYSATGLISEQLMFILLGTGSNGKSLFLKIIRTVLGSYAMDCPFNTFDASRRSEMTNDLARLKGARFVTIIETDDRYMDEARVKAAVGGDRITARFLHKEYFEFDPTFKLWMATNWAPKVRQGGHGIWRKIRIVPFNARFDDGNRDDGMEKKLLDEIENGHVLDWIMEGVKLWRAERLSDTPASVKAATEAYRKDCDVIGQWLEDEVETGEKVASATVYQSYKMWCESQGLKSLSHPNFGKQLSARGFDAVKSTGGRMYYKGWSIRQPAVGNRLPMRAEHAPASAAV